MTHQPDSPFGCGEQWGTELPTWLDMQVHICNRPSDHRGDHLCACGKRRPR